MDTATAITIVLAALAILAGYRQVVVGIKNQRKLADLSDVRGVLDEAAVALHKISYSLDSVRLVLASQGPLSGFRSKQGREALEELGKHGRDIEALRERLAIRFGEAHEIVTTFSETTTAALEIARAGLALSRLPTGTDPSTVKQASTLAEEPAQRIKAQRETFDAARAAFVKAAVRRAGAELDD